MACSEDFGTFCVVKVCIGWGWGWGEEELGKLGLEEREDIQYNS